MKKLWVVCTGNICRSPMGVAILRQKISKLGLQDEYVVKGGGTTAFEGDIVSENSVIVMEEIGIDISNYRAHRISKEEMEQADHIFVMTSHHKDAILSMAKEANDKISVLNVDDPYGFGLDVYRRCRDQIMDYFEDLKL